jgi:hypothetical protein
MSLNRIEYPTIEMARVAAMMTYGDISEKKLSDQDETVFFQVVRNEPLLSTSVTLNVVGYWSPQKNFGVVYNKPTPSENK